MANPAEIALRWPKVVALLFALALIYGALSFAGLPRQENPTLPDRFVQVTVYLPGASPARVERMVTRVLEDEIARVDDIADLFSRSSAGRSFLTVELEPGAPLETRLQEVRERVSGAREKLAAGASEPEVDTEVLRTQTLLLALTGPAHSGRELRRRARWLTRELAGVGGVRRVTATGLPEEEIEVAVDLLELANRGLSIEAVAGALRSRNTELPGGEIELGQVRSNLHTSGAFDAVAQVEHTVLAQPAAASGSPDGDRRSLQLGDLAKVRRRLADAPVRVRHNGHKAVVLGLEMQDGGNAIAFGERIRAWMHTARERLPPGFDLAVVADEPAYVERRLSRLFVGLGLGMVLVVAVCFAGLGWRAGAVVSLSIPLSAVVAMGLLALLGVSLHQISIAALVIATGLVVDEAIVITDAIQRKRDQGEPARRAVVSGLGEIHLAVLAGAGTTVAAFLPLALMEGDVGAFVRAIPLVVCSMLLASLLVSHFVTPLAWLALQPREPEGLRGPGAERLLALYARVLARATSHPRAMLAGFAAAFAVSALAIAAFLWPPRFFPSADRNQLVVDVRMAAGAPVESTLAATEMIGRWLDEQPEVHGWTAFAGSSAPKFYYNEFSEGRAEDLGMLVVDTDPALSFRTTRRIIERLNREFASRIPGAFVRARELAQGYGGGADISIYVTGDDLEVLRRVTGEISEIARSEAGVATVWDSFGYDRASLAARIDPLRAERLGVRHEDVAQALRHATEGIVATHYPEADEEIPIVVRLEASQRNQTSLIRLLPVSSEGSGASPRAPVVPLGQVATLEPDFAPGTILRFDRTREGAITIDVAGSDVRGVTDRIEARVRAETVVPEGLRLLFYGERKEANESFLSLARAALVAILLIYTILVVRFQSLAQPVLIVLAIPMALVGSIWGLVVTGMPLAFTAFLGMIALTGIAVNDSIVLVDAINRLRAHGTPLDRAITIGAESRVRPVVMTSATTIAGLLPLSLSGGEFWGPFGFAMIFGLLASTILTLLVLPAAYRLLASQIRGDSRAQGSVQPTLH